MKDGNESPESGSLYSDEIPSGYNSGEQYDTVSCGYMSGEAYELPETRMELREPALEVIEECIQPLGTFANSDQDIFRMPFITMGKIYLFQLLTLESMAIQVVEFSSGGYKIRNIFA